MICKYFPPFHELSFQFLDGIPLNKKGLIFMMSNLSSFLFLACAFGVKSQKHCLTQGHKDLLLCFLLRDLQLWFTQL